MTDPLATPTTPPPPPPTWLRGLGGGVIGILTLCVGYAVAIALHNWSRIGV